MSARLIDFDDEREFLSNAPPIAYHSHRCLIRFILTRYISYFGRHLLYFRLFDATWLDFAAFPASSVLLVIIICFIVTAVLARYATPRHTLFANEPPLALPTPLNYRESSHHRLALGH